MRWRLGWDSAATAPPASMVLADCGVLDRQSAPPHIVAMVQEALATYTALCEPRAVLQEIDQAAFRRVYEGEGHNSTPAPLEDVLRGAEALALFVGTVGARPGETIARLFAANEPARAYVLDAVASAAADGLAAAAADDFARRLEAAGLSHPTLRVLAYSPGYCGWHITGQRALFAALDPADIGVRLSESCLMAPLKSVSGVLVAAPLAAHEFYPGYPCCEACATRACESRMAALRRPSSVSSGPCGTFPPGDRR